MKVRAGKLVVKRVAEQRVISGGVPVDGQYIISEVLAVAEDSKYRVGDQVMYRDWAESESPVGPIVDEWDVVVYSG